MPSKNAETQDGQAKNTMPLAVHRMGSEDIINRYVVTFKY